MSFRLFKISCGVFAPSLPSVSAPSLRSMRDGSVAPWRAARLFQGDKTGNKSVISHFHATTHITVSSSADSSAGFCWVLGAGTDRGAGKELALAGWFTATASPLVVNVHPTVWMQLALLKPRLQETRTML